MSINIVASGPSVTADEKLVALLRAELLDAREMMRGLAALLVSKEGGTLLTETLEDIGKHKRRVEILQQEFLSYFSRVAPSLYNREEWMGIFSKIGGVVDKLGGLAHRIEFLLTKPWDLPAPVRDLLAKMASLLLLMTDHYLTMMNAALTNRARALDARDKVTSGEKEMDSLYRSVIFTTLDANLTAPAMFLLLNIAELIEDVADLLNSAADNLYLITLSTAGL